MAIISRLAVLLGLDAGEFNQGLGKAKTQVEGFSAASKVSLAAVGTAFAALATDAIKFADEINDVAKANEVAVESVLQLSQALAINGGNATDTAKIFATFTNKIDESVQGSDKLRKSFQDLGVTTKDLANLTEQELFEKALKGLSAIEDPIRRNALAFDILGKSVKGVDIKSLYEDYEKAKGSFEGSNETYKRVGESLDKLSIIWLHFKDNLAKAVLPVLEAIIFALEKIHQLNKFLDPYFEKADKFFGMGPKGAEGSSSYKPVDYTGPVGPNFSAQASKASAQRKLELTDAQKAAQKLLQTQTQYYEKEVAISKAKAGRVAKENELAFLGENERKRQLGIYDIEEKLKQLAIEKKMTKQQIDAYGEVEKARVEQEYKIAESQRTFEYGWKKAYASYVDDATNAARMGQEAFVSVTQNMESALDNFVKTGKLNFADLARSIISDLIKIQLKAQATKLFGGFDLGGLLGGIFKGGSSYSPGYSTLAAAPYPKFAAGGGISGPSIVGENGPELFIPKGAGTIIPNNQMGSAMGGGAQVVYNGPYIANMNAIDTQSATQFLSKNKNAVFAANQSATRSLPQSRT